MQVLQHLQVTSSSCHHHTSACIPWTTLLVCVFQHVQVTSPSCTPTSCLIPWTIILSQPHQYFQVTSISCKSTGLLIEKALLRTSPLFPILEGTQVARKRCSIHDLDALLLCSAQKAHSPMAPFFTHSAQLLIFGNVVWISSERRRRTALHISLELSPRSPLHASQLLADARERHDAVVVHTLEYLVPKLVRQHLVCSL